MGLVIGIPVYNDLENLKAMLKSFVSSTAAYDKITLVVSESDDGTKQFVDCLPKKSYEIIHTPKEGPLKAYNKIFEIAKERKADLFITQTDVTFPKCHKRDWLEDMRKVATVEECGIVTCYGGGGQSGPDFISGYNWVGAWCTYIPYRTIEKIGGFDNNIPLGYGVDIDYTYAVEQAGLQVYVINYWVDHFPEYDNAHEHERVDDFEEQKKEAFAYMRKKWNLQKTK